jgi:hypothetical protein
MVSKKVFGRTLRATVSAAALTLAAPLAATAQDGATPNWWVSVEGQYTFINGDAFDVRDLYYDDSSFSLEPDDGWTGRLNLGAKIGQDWFVEGGLRYGASGKDSGEFYYVGEGYYEFGELNYDENHLVLDLSIGRDVGIGDGGEVRAFAGLRFARFKGNSRGVDYYYYDGGEGYFYEFEQLHFNHSFQGFGPRIGLDALIPVANKVRVDVGVAGALLYGRRKLSATYIYDGYSDRYSDSDKGWIPNVEANAALTYVFSPSASISAGFRVEYFGDVMPQFDTDTFLGGDIGKEDRVIYGPFVRLTIMGQ